MFKILSCSLTFISISNLLKIQDLVSASTEFLISTQNKISPLSDKSIFNYRLPIEVQPIIYDLKLDTYLNEHHEKNSTFDGVVNIQMKIEKATPSINLHAHGLKLKHIEVNNDHSNNISVTWEHNSLIDLLEIFNGSKNLWMPSNNYTVEIEFEGKFLNDLDKGVSWIGYEAKSYTNDQGKEAWYAATRFQPDGARWLFPCFDEPGFKAAFHLQITHHKNFSVISNTEVEYETSSDTDDRVTTVFKTTPLMSTYNFSIFVSDFLKRSDKAKNHTIYFPPTEKLSSALFAIQMGDSIFEKFTEYTEVSFELNKLNLSAIPGNQSVFENWGTIFFSPSAVLYDPEYSSLEEKTKIAIRISHEYAHQWFGNLVTCKKWEYFWLHEGLATFFSTHILYKVEPKWKSYLDFSKISVQNSAFASDNDLNTHPVEGELEDDFIRDFIVNNKGACMFHMLQHIVIETNFKAGLQAFLKKYKFGIVEPDDLFNMIQTKINKYKLPYDLRRIMDSWVTNKGYPIVNVTRDYTTNMVRLEQKRFSWNDLPEDMKNQTWLIPINYATRNIPDFDQTAPNVWLDVSENNIEVDATSDDWLILNKKQSGFYRVIYDERNWELITNYLQTPSRVNIHVSNRAQLMIDAIEFHDMTLLSLSPILNLIDSMKYETEYAVLFYGFKVISWLHEKLLNTVHYLNFKKKIINNLETLFELIGVKESDDEDFTKKLSRGLIIEWLCKLENSKYTKQMQEQFKGWLNNPNKTIISTDIKYAIFYCGLKNSTQKEIDSISDKLLKSDNVFEKNITQAALLATYDENHLNSVFLNSQESTETVFEKNPNGLDSFLNFLSSNLNSIINNNTITEVENIFNFVIGKISTKEQLEKLHLLAQKSSKTENFTQSADGIFHVKELWLTYNSDILENWLKIN